MKAYLLFAVFAVLSYSLCLAQMATPAPVSVAGPIVGWDGAGHLLHVDPAGPGSAAFAVYQVDATGALVEASGQFYFEGVPYATGYAFASSYLTVCKNRHL